MPPSPGGPPSEASSAGALLGIHNIYIVLPQFLVSFLSSLVFAAIEPKSSTGDPTGREPVAPVEETAGDPDTIGVMLRFGGVMAGIAALLSLRLWKQPRSVAPSSPI
jgi:solute carrier family 45 protein 1/2/4